MSRRDRPVLTVRHKPDETARQSIVQALMAGMASPFVTSEQLTVADLLARSGTPTLGYGFSAEPAEQIEKPQA